MLFRSPPHGGEAWSLSAPVSPPRAGESWHGAAVTERGNPSRKREEPFFCDCPASVNRLEMQSNPLETASPGIWEQTLVPSIFPAGEKSCLKSHDNYGILMVYYQIIVFLHVAVTDTPQADAE